MPIQPTPLDFNDPHIRKVPRQMSWVVPGAHSASSDHRLEIIVPEGHFWEVVRLTASSNTTTAKQVSCKYSTGDNYGDADYDTTSQASAWWNTIGWADTPAATDAANNPYPGSCVVFADKNLPLFLYSGSRIELSAAEGYGEVEGYMAYFDYHF